MAKATNSKLVNIYKEMFGKHSLSLKGIESKIVRIGTDTQIIAKNAVVLPAMAKDMSIMRLNMQKMVKLMGGTPSMKASSFFKDASAREAQYEEQRKKAAGNLSPTSLNKDKDVGGVGGKGGFLSGFFGTILKAILAAGILGTLFNTLDEETKQSIRDFFKKMLIGFFNGITTTFQEISKLLKDPKVQESFQNALQAIFNTIKDGFKLLWETQINTPLGKYNIFEIVGGVILAFVGLKAAILLMASFVYKLARGLGGLLGGALLGGGTRKSKKRPKGKSKVGKLMGKGKMGLILAALATLGGASLLQRLGVFDDDDDDEEEDEDVYDEDGVPRSRRGSSSGKESAQSQRRKNAATAGRLAIDTALAGAGVYYGIKMLPKGKPPPPITRPRPSSGTPITALGSIGEARAAHHAALDKNFVQKLWDKLTKLVSKIGPKELLSRISQRFGSWIAIRMSATIAGIAAAPLTMGFSAFITLVSAAGLGYTLYEIYEFLEELDKEESGSISPAPAEPAGEPGKEIPYSNNPDDLDNLRPLPPPGPPTPTNFDFQNKPSESSAGTPESSDAAPRRRRRIGEGGRPVGLPGWAPTRVDDTGLESRANLGTRFIPTRIPPSGVTEDFITRLKIIENEPLATGKIKTHKAEWDNKQFSVGYGTKSFEGEEIDEAEADKRLRKKASEMYQYVIGYEKKYGYIWNEPQRQALTSFAFNFGTLDKLTNNGKRTNEEIANKLPEYNKEGTPPKPNEGLMKRRGWEQALFTSNPLTAVAQKQPTPAPAADLPRETMSNRASIPTVDLTTRGLPSLITNKQPESDPTKIKEPSLNVAGLGYANLDFLHAGDADKKPTIALTASGLMGNTLSTIMNTMAAMENEFKKAIEEGRKKGIDNIFVDNSQRNTTTTAPAQTVASAYDKEMFETLVASVSILGSH